jgi:hypothetical protein
MEDQGGGKAQGVADPPKKVYSGKKFPRNFGYFCH